MEGSDRVVLDVVVASFYVGIRGDIVIFFKGDFGINYLARLSCGREENYFRL